MMKQDDHNNTFYQCLTLFVRGMRRDVKKRLVDAYGDSWWTNGVERALSDGQRENLYAAIQPGTDPDYSEYLDAYHFPTIIKRNHSIAFSDVFPDLDVAYRQMREVSNIRNEWAHIPGERGLGPEALWKAIRSMHSVLLALGSREVIEIAEIIASRQAAHPAGTSEQGVTSMEEKRTMDEESEPQLDLWKQLQSYLDLTFTVEQREERSRPTLFVNVQVSNVAPTGVGRPVVSFKEIRLQVSSQRGGQSIPMGNLDPGRTVSKDISLVPEEAASVEIGVEGSVDWQQFFVVRRQGQLPESVVTPLLAEFRRRFLAIGLDEPLSAALDAVKTLGPQSSLEEAHMARTRLAQARVLIESKQEELQELFRHFHLNKQTRLGAHLHDAWMMLNEIGGKIEAVESALSANDPSAIEEAISSLEKLKVAVLRIEEDTRAVTNREPR